MLFVFNKNKIISYTIAASVVVVLFLFSVAIVNTPDAKLIQVSSNITNTTDQNNEIQNNNVNKWRYYEQREILLHVKSIKRKVVL